MTSLNITAPTSDMLLSREPADTSCAVRIYDVAYLVLDEDHGVSVDIDTRYGSDMTPMAVWHGRVLRWQIASAQGGAVMLSAASIADALAEGEALRSLIERVAAGHSVDLDQQSNWIGSLTDDAGEASAAVDRWLANSDLKADVEIWDAEMWAYGTGCDRDVLSIFGLSASSSDEQVAASAAEGEAWAKGDGILLTGDLAAALTQARDNVRAREEDEDE